MMRLKVPQWAAESRCPASSSSASSGKSNSAANASERRLAQGCAKVLEAAPSASSRYESINRWPSPRADSNRRPHGVSVRGVRLITTAAPSLCREPTSTLSEALHAGIDHLGSEIPYLVLDLANQAPHPDRDDAEPRGRPDTPPTQHDRSNGVRSVHNVLTQVCPTHPDRQLRPCRPFGEIATLPSWRERKNLERQVVAVSDQHLQPSRFTSLLYSAAADIIRAYSLEDDTTWLSAIHREPSNHSLPPYPSPAANRGWAQAVTATLVDAGIWDACGGSVDGQLAKLS